MGSSSGETYDDTSIASIVFYSHSLIGKSLAEASNVEPDKLRAKGKGGLGVLVEWAYFDLQSSNKPEPDFERVGLELKTTPLKKYVRDKKPRCKENLKLTTLNPFEVDVESWATSRVVSKCGLMLILTYMHEDGKPPEALRFTEVQKVINLLDKEQVDSTQFRLDFEKIQRFIREGRAHELSCGDTSYLIANTSGAGKGKGLRKQPYSAELMKPRSFMIRKDYLDVILLGAEAKNVLPTSGDMSIEDSAMDLLAPHLGKTINELAAHTSFFGSTRTDKAYYRGLSVRLLGGNGRSIPEFDKAGIKLKVIRLKKTGIMREEMSFKNFQPIEIVSELWEESTFFEEIQQKFLFVVFKETEDGSEVLYKAGFWTMPYQDRLEAQEVWEETKRRIANNNHALPGISETRVAHVRPHARNKMDTYPTPHGGAETKKSFWLNRSYLRHAIEELSAN